MPSPRLQPTFARLSACLQRHFGGEDCMWFPSAAGGTSYTVAVPCRQSAHRGASQPMAGMLSMDAGTITLQAEKSAFPFPPDEQQIFLLGPPAGGGAPAASAVKYEITEVSGPEMFTHYEITARRH
jgi:hypothetical protein